jgi:hypothetical protein
MKKVVYEIEHCNSRCIHFYHNFYDGENIWCAKSNKKVYDYSGNGVWHDYEKRQIPEECPLDSK